MSKKSKKKRKAKQKLLQKKLVVLAEKKVEETAPKIKVEKEEKTPKVKRITKIKTAIKEKKAAIKNKIQEKRTFVFESSQKIWKIAIIFGTALLSLFIQYYVFNIYNPELIQTNAAQIRSTAAEAYKISSVFDIVDTEKNNPGHYLATGETDKDIYSFAISSKGDKPAVLKELILTKTGDIPANYLTNIRLFEGENAIAKAEIKNDKFVFKKITSILQPGTEKTYVIKTDVTKDGSSGVRFRLSLVNPTDITIEVDENPVFALDTYPFDGAYTTVVGWRKK